MFENKQSSVCFYYSLFQLYSQERYPASLGRRFLNRSNVLCDSLQKDSFLTLQ